jgi:hypothetical protein
VADRVSRRWVWATALLTGGAFAVAAALAPPASAPAGRGLAWALFIGSPVHVAATGWLFTLPGVRRHARQRTVRYGWLPVILVSGGAATCAAAPPPVFTWLLLPYFAWQFFHFAKQNIGVVALAASAEQLPPLRRAERRVLLLTGAAGTGGLVAHPGLLQLRVDTELGALLRVCAAASGLAIAAGAVLLARRPCTPGFCLIYLMALAFFAPVFVFTSPYAAVGGMTIAHGLQYLLLVGLVASTETNPVLRVAVLCNVAVAGGLVLSLASHLHGAAPGIRWLYGAYLGVVMSHFVIDAGIWRRRGASDSPLRLPMHRKPI